MSEQNRYPSLSDDAKQSAAKVLEDFRSKLKQVANDALDEIYIDVANHVECDSWKNYRNSIWDYVLDYRNLYGHEAKRMRDRIFQDNREQIIKEIGADLVEENARLEKRILEIRGERFGGHY